MQADTKKCIERMRSRLERWELSHLRELAASLHTQLEEAQERAEHAEASAEFWQHDCFELEAELRATGATIGMTVDGALHVMQGGAA